MEEAGDLLEASWFFENLLHTKSRTMSRCYSDLSSSSCSTQEHVKNERESSRFSSRKAEPVVSEPQSFLTKKLNPNPGLTRVSSMSISVVGSDQKDHVNVEKERKSSSFSSRKAEPVSSETQSFLMKNPNPSRGLTRVSSMSISVVGSDQKDHVNVEKERKSSSFSSRKQRPVVPRSLTRVPSLPNSIETQSFVTKKLIPSCVVVSDEEDEEEDQESEFSLGRLIRQASMNSSRTLNPPRKTDKAMTENLQKKPELYQEKIGVMDSMENRSKSIKNSRKNTGGGGGGGGPAIPGGWVDKSSSEDMKAHIKFWARAVASNVRQECS